jgi:hypothetical protein
LLIVSDLLPQLDHDHSQAEHITLQRWRHGGLNFFLCQ